MALLAKPTIKKFGGIRPCARAGGWPVSTVQSWNEAGVIPYKREAEVLAAARDGSLALGPDCFSSNEEAEAQ